MATPKMKEKAKRMRAVRTFETFIAPLSTTKLQEHLWTFTHLSSDFDTWEGRLLNHIANVRDRLPVQVIGFTAHRELNTRLGELARAFQNVYALVDELHNVAEKQEYRR